MLKAVVQNGDSGSKHPSPKNNRENVFILGPRRYCGWEAMSSPGSLGPRCLAHVRIESVGVWGFPGGGNKPADTMKMVVVVGIRLLAPRSMKEQSHMMLL